MRERRRAAGGSRIARDRNEEEECLHSLAPADEGATDRAVPCDGDRIRVDIRTACESTPVPARWRVAICR